jgi:hypothetical protein
MVFHIHSGYGVLKSRWWKWASVGLITQNGLPSRDSSSAFGLNEVMPIQ